MRRLVLAAVLCAAAAPAWAAKPPPVIDPDPMTVSGRFELPKAAPAEAGRVKLGVVTLDEAFAANAKLDPAALRTALAAAAERSLRNFGYAGSESDGGISLDLTLAAETQPVDGGLRATAHLKASASDPCFARTAEGVFKVLPRERSGAGKRVFAVAASVAVGLATGAGGVNSFLPAELESASAENKARNAARAVGPAEGVAPAFGEASAVRFGEMSAIRLALADYIRQLGETAACKAA
jgi:hypothetical protein